MPELNSRVFFGGQRLAAALGLAGILAACSGGTPGDKARLTASWTGGDSGQLAAPATAAWCASGGLLEIMAIAGDTGVALLLYPTDGVRSGSFTVIDPLRLPVHAGGAALAARWPAAEQIVGYRGVSGAVRLRVESGTLAGDMEGLLLRPGAEAESLHFVGSFAGLQADSGPTACPPDSNARHVPADSSYPHRPREDMPR